jgi:hypothetical protein
MPEDFDDRLDDLATLTRRVAAVVFKIDEALDELRAFNRQQIEINADIKATLARIETLIARLPRGGENGRDA